MFGLRRSQKPPGGLLDVDEATTACEVYNNRALSIDGELIKDWNASLNTLLIFAALYSAVLTAFIVESMKLLQEDPDITTRDALLVISQQLANGSVPPFKPDPFVPPPYAVRINYYFFLSISSSLVAALAAVLALQWVGSYDAGLNQSSPQDRALQRHFRHLGLEKWKMVQIIAFLPALIFLALFLFFIGLAEWMWVLHSGVAGVVIAGLVCGASFSLITTVIGMVCVEAPFQSPASRSLPRLLSSVYRSFIKYIVYSMPKEVHRTTGRRNNDPSPINGRLTRLWNECRRRLVALRDRIRNSPLTGTFEARGERRVKSVVDMKRTSLVWLMNQVNVLPHTAGYFRSVIKELLHLPPEKILGSSIGEAPWEAIFMVLLEPYLARHRSESHFSEEEILDLEPILRAFTLVWDIPESNFDFNSFLVTACASTSPSISYLAGLALQRSQGQIRYLFGQLHIALGCAPASPPHFTIAHLLRLYIWQKKERNQYKIIINATYHSDDGGLNLSKMLAFDFSDITSFVLPEEAMGILYDILSWRYMDSHVRGDTPMERYLSAVETFLEQEQDNTDRQAVEDIHDSILTQILGNTVQSVYRSEHVGHKSLLQNLVWFLRLKHSPIKHEASITAIFQILDAWKYEIMDASTKLLVARIYGLIIPNIYSPDNESWDWAEWRTHIYLGLDSLLRIDEWSSPSSQQLVWKQADMAARRLHEPIVLSTSQTHRISRVQDSILRLYASAGTGLNWVYPSALPVVNGVNQESWEVALTWWCNSLRGKESMNSSELKFIRAILSDSPVHTKAILSGLVALQKVDDDVPSSEHWHMVLPQYTLQRIYPWFFREFGRAGGFRWLVDSTSLWSFDGTTDIICSGIYSSDNEEGSKTWMSTLHQVLATSASFTQKRHSKESGRLIGIISQVLSAQLIARNVLVGDALDPAVEQDIRTRHAYARNWCEFEWKEWQDMLSDILGGLVRGFIELGLSQSSACLYRDPIGGCSRVFSTSARLDSPLDGISG